MSTHELVQLLVGLGAAVIGYRLANIDRPPIDEGIKLVLKAASPEWIPGSELRRAFGGRTYWVLRDLEERMHGMIERRTEPGGPERGGRERGFYRWNPRP